MTKQDEVLITVAILDVHIRILHHIYWAHGNDEKYLQTTALQIGWMAALINLIEE